jgi:hypothetical protein
LELIPTNIDSNTKKYKEMHRISQLFNDGSTVPTAFVTVGRQRVKQYGNTVYLNNGNEFEIELFNPTTTKVLAKIVLNGISIGSGIVLRPAERVFLERYLNESKKFLFETYEVDGDNPSVQKAIIENGKVSIKFYSEYINYGITVTNSGYSWGAYNPTAYNPTWQTSHTSCFQSYSAPIHSTPTSIHSHKLSKSVNLTNNFVEECSMSPELESPVVGALTQPMETGRIEKGSISNQGFTYDATTFNTWWSWSSEWKILPMSQKSVVQEDLIVYCGNCRARRKKSTHKYCPNCGEKY